MGLALTTSPNPFNPFDKPPVFLPVSSKPLPVVLLALSKSSLSFFAVFKPIPKPSKPSVKSTIPLVRVRVCCNLNICASVSSLVRPNLLMAASAISIPPASTFAPLDNFFNPSSDFSTCLEVLLTSSPKFLTLLAAASASSPKSLIPLPSNCLLVFWILFNSFSISPKSSMIFSVPSTSIFSWIVFISYIYLN